MMQHCVLLVALGKGAKGEETPSMVESQQVLLSPVIAPLHPTALHLLCSGVLSRDGKPWSQSYHKANSLENKCI